MIAVAGVSGQKREGLMLGISPASVGLAFGGTSASVDLSWGPSAGYYQDSETGRKTVGVRFFSVSWGG